MADSNQNRALVLWGTALGFSAGVFAATISIAPQSPLRVRAQSNRPRTTSIADSAKPVIAQADPQPTLPARVPERVVEGYTLLEQGLVDDAILTFRQAIADFPASIEAKLGLAIALRRAGRDRQSWEAYGAVLAQEPDNVLALETVGQLGTFRPEWYEGGLEALDRLIEIAPNRLSARLNRARILSFQQRFEAATADYEVALRLDPTPELQLEAAKAFAFSGQHPRAIALFEQYFAAGRDLAEKDAAIAYALSLQGVERAVEALEVLRPRQADTQVAAVLASILVGLAAQPDAPEEYQSEAIAIYTRLLAIEDLDAEIILAAASFYSTVPERQLQSLELYDRLTALFPGDRSFPIMRLAVESVVLSEAPTSHPLVQQLSPNWMPGFVYQLDLRERLQALVLPDLDIPPERQQPVGQTLVRVDPLDPELLPIFESLQQAEIDLPLIDFRLAQLQIELGDRESARTTIAAAVAEQGDAFADNAELLLAEIDRREGRLDASIQRYERLLARSADPAIRRGATLSLAGANISLNNLERARRLYEQLLAIEPLDLQAEVGLTTVLLAEESLSEREAAEVLDRWLERFPFRIPSPEVFALASGLPSTSARLGLYEGLLAVRPQDFGVQVRLVEALAATDLLAARARLDEFRERVAPESEAARQLSFLAARLLQEAGDLDGAAAAYETIVATDPQDTDALLALAELRQQQGNGAAALALYERIVRSDPDRLEAWLALAELRSEAGDEAGEAEALAAIAQIETNNLEVLFPLADFRREQGELAEALQIYERIVAIEPENIGALQALAGTATELGQIERALLAYETLLTVAPNSTDVLLGFAGLQLQIGDLEESHQLYQQVLALDPTNAAALDAILNILPAQPDAPERFLREAIALYDEQLSQPDPDPAIVRDAALLFATVPDRYSQALQLFDRLIVRFPTNRSYTIQQLALESIVLADAARANPVVQPLAEQWPVGFLYHLNLRDRLQAALALPETEPERQQQIAEVLARIDPPDPDLLEVYQQLLDAQVDVPLLDFRVAQMWVEREKAVAAKAALEIVLARGGIGAAGAELLLAELDRQAGSIEESMQRYETLLNHPDGGVRRGAILGLAGLQVAREDFERARQLYNLALRDNPEDLQAIAGLAAANYLDDALSQPEAEAVLAQWLDRFPFRMPTAEFTRLATALPADLDRLDLYEGLLAFTPANRDLQIHIVAALSQLEPVAARTRLEEFRRQMGTGDGHLAQALHFISAQLHVDRGNLSAAAADYNAILADDPDAVAALLGLAALRREQGDESAALELYERVRAIAPGNLEVWFALADLRQQRGDEAGALQAYAEVLQLDPENVQVRFARADLRRRQGNLAAALEDYEQILAIAPANLPALQSLAGTATELEQFDRALLAYETLQTLAPDSADVLLGLAGLRLRQGALLEAQVLYEQVLAIAPDNETALDALLNVLPLQPNAPESLRQDAFARYEALLAESNVSVETLRKTAKFFSQFPEKQLDALAVFDRLIALSPSDRNLPALRLVTESVLLSRANASNERVQELALDWNPGFLYQLELRDRLRLALRPPLPTEREQQQELAEFLVRLDPPNPQLLAIYQSFERAGLELPLLPFRIAQMQLERGLTDAARQTLTALVADEGDFAESAQLLLLDLELQEGANVLSRQRYETLIANSSNPEVVRGARLSLAGLLAQQGDRPAAIAQYDALLDANPTDLQAEVGLAALSLQEETIELEAAEAILERWFDRFPFRIPPAEAIALLNALPGSGERLPLYEGLLALRPENAGLRVRFIEALAAIDPVAARTRLEDFRRRLSPGDVEMARALNFASAQLSVAEGDLEGAAAIYDSLLTGEPDDIELLLALADVRQQQGNGDAALQIYERIRRLEPENIDALFVLADLKRQQNDLAGAAQVYGELLAIAPDNLPALFALASFRQEQGEFDRALAAYERIVAIEPENIGALQGLAGSLAELGQVDRALVTYDTLLLLAPDSTDVLLGLAGLQLQRGDLLESRRLYNRVLAKDPDNPVALDAVLNILPAQPDAPASFVQDAIALYDDLLSAPNPDPALVRSAAAFFGTLPGQRQTALDLYRDLADRFPEDDSLPVQQLALEAILLRDADSSEPLVTERSRQWPIGFLYQPELQDRLQAALAAAAIADPARQRDVAQLLVRLDPPDPALLATYQEFDSPAVDVPFLAFRIAQMQLELGQNEAARQTLTSAAATRGPDFAASAELLIASLERQVGRADRSIRRYEDIIASEDLESEEIRRAAILNLAGLRAAQNEREAARELYERLLSDNPDDLQAQLGLASLDVVDDRIADVEGEALLDSWFDRFPFREPPPEVYRLVSELSPRVERLDLYSAMLELEPEAFGVQIRRIEALALLDPVAAQAELTALKRQFPADSSEGVALNFLAARLRLEREDFDGALAAYREIVDADARNVGAWLALADLLRQLDDPAAAREAYQRIVRLEPDNVSALFALAELERQEGQLNAAARLLTGVVAAQPENIAAWQALGGVRAEQGQVDRAAAAYETILELDPDNLDAIQGLASKRFEQGQLEDAFQLFEQVLAADPDNEVALEALLDSLPSQPGASDAIRAKAIALYDDILADPTTEADTLREAANFFSRLPAQRDRALELYDRLVQDFPADDTLRVQRLAIESVLLREADSDDPLVQELSEDWEIGFLYQVDLKERLQQVLLPIALIPPEQQLDAAQSVVRLDPPNSELMAFYEILREAEAVDVPFIDFRIAQMQLEEDDTIAARRTLARGKAAFGEDFDANAELLLADIDLKEDREERAIRRYEALLDDRDLELPSVARGAALSLAGLRIKRGERDEARRLYRELLRNDADDLQAEVGLVAVSLIDQLASRAEGEEMLDRWFERFPFREPPPEVYTLVAVLPTDFSRLELYEAMLVIEPDDVNVRLRYIEALARVDPAEARAQLTRLRRTVPPETDEGRAVNTLNNRLQLATDDAIASAADSTPEASGTPGRTRPPLRPAVGPSAPRAIASFGSRSPAVVRTPPPPRLVAAAPPPRGVVDAPPQAAPAPPSPPSQPLPPGSSPAQAPPARATVGELFAFAEARKQVGDFVGAAAAYERIVSLDPNNAGAWFALADARRQLGDVVGAKQAFEVTRSLDPTNPDVYFALGDFLQSLGDFDGALAVYGQLLAIDPSNIDARFVTANAYRRQGRLDLAARTYEEIIELDPNNVNALQALAGVRAELGQTELAVRAYERLIVLQPSAVDPLLALGGIRFSQGRLEEARDLYERALALDPTNDIALSAAQSLFWAQFDREGAEQPVSAYRQLREFEAEDEVLGDPPDTEVLSRLRRIELNFLRRRGFQPRWERF